jgi:hypothetical protein
VREPSAAEPTVNSPPQPTINASPSQPETSVTGTAVYNSQETTSSKMKEEQLEPQKPTGDNTVLIVLTSCLGVMVLVMGSIMGYNYYRKQQGQEPFVWTTHKKLSISPLQSIYSTIHFPGGTVISTDSKPSFLERRAIHDDNDDHNGLLNHQVRDSYITIGPDSSVSQRGRDTKLYSGIEPLKEALVRAPRVTSTLSFSTSQLQDPASNYMQPKEVVDRPFSFEHTPTDLVGTFIELPYSSCDEDLQHDVIQVPNEI